jgi:hypothetical protein
MEIASVPSSVIEIIWWLQTQIVRTYERVIIRSWRVGVTKEVQTCLSISVCVCAYDKLWPYDCPVVFVRGADISMCMDL